MLTGCILECTILTRLLFVLFLRLKLVSDKWITYAFQRISPENIWIHNGGSLINS